MKQMDGSTGRKKALALLALGLALSAAPMFAQTSDFQELDMRFEPLRTQFNADAGKVRLILLLDPT